MTQAIAYAGTVTNSAYKGVIIYMSFTYRTTGYISSDSAMRPKPVGLEIVGINRGYHYTVTIKLPPNNEITVTYADLEHFASLARKDAAGKDNVEYSAKLKTLLIIGGGRQASSVTPIWFSRNSMADMLSFDLEKPGQLSMHFNALEDRIARDRARLA